MPLLAPRIALVHALEASMAPINAAFARAWPEARRMNLLDDSLSADLARAGRLDGAMRARFIALADYAVAQHAQAILFTCSAFGPCIEAVQARLAPLPVLKPNEAMIDEAVALARERGGGPNGPNGPNGPDGPVGPIGPIGLVASFGPTLDSMPGEFPPGAPLLTGLARGALEALQAGDAAAHDAAVAAAAEQLAAQGCTLIALAQFSLARAAPLVAARTGLPVLTTPDSALRRLQRAFAGR